MSGNMSVEFVGQCRSVCRSVAFVGQHVIRFVLLRCEGGSWSFFCPGPNSFDMVVVVVVVRFVLTVAGVC